MDVEAEAKAEAESLLGAPVREAVRLAHGRVWGVTEGVWRVTADNGRRAVLKLLRDGGEGWRREPDVYAAGLPTAYVNAGIRLPELLARVDRGERSIALWLEDVNATPAARWTPAQYGAASRRFGLAQGGVSPGDRGASYWRTGFLRTHLDHWEGRVDWALLEDDDAWRHPLIAEHFDPSIRDYARRAHAEREAFTAWWEALPHTVCHNDVWPNNLFGDPGTTAPVTAIDWAFAGHAPFGADVGNLVSDSALDLLRPAADVPALDAAAFEGYVAGLREAGAAIDPGLVRLGMLLTTAKWAFLVPAMLAQAAKESHTVYGDQAADTHHLYAERAAVLRHMAAWADEARALAAGHL
jgi:hypothetical protein